MILHGREALLLRTHEVSLKKGNRRRFEQILNRNITHLLKREFGSQVRITHQHGRMLLLAPYPQKLATILKRCFGLSSFDPVALVETDLATILQKSREMMNLAQLHFPDARTFRVRAKRSEKQNSMGPSTETDRTIGRALCEDHPNLTVDLKKPDLTLRIEIRNKITLLSIMPGDQVMAPDSHRGPGGLPVGANARALALMSGGIDSPIAALKVLQRGSAVSFLHFHGTPYVGSDVLDKVQDLVALINQFQPTISPLRVVPFGKLQEKIALRTQSKLRTVLFRRMMMRIGCQVAEKTRALALVTGESLGQVASQTLENIRAIDNAATLPVLRPLIGYDKDEIISLAHRFGTFSISVKPAVDCCTLFADHHPSLYTTLEEIHEEESKFPVQEWAEEALTQIHALKPNTPTTLAETRI